MSQLTVTAGPSTKKVDYTATTTATSAKALLGVCSDDFDASVARIGPLKVARKYCGGSDELNKHRQFVIDHPSVHVIISVVTTGMDRAKFVAQMAAWPITPGGTTVVPNHEPFGSKKPFTPATFGQSVLDFSSDYQSAGSPAHILKGVILHGWFESSQPWAVKAFKDLGGYDAVLPAEIRARVHVVGWDLYDDANYPNYGKNLGPGYKLDRCSALAKSWGKPFMLGEVGSFDPVNQKDFFDRLAKSAYPPARVAWWDHADTHSLVEGDLLTWFRAAM